MVVGGCHHGGVVVVGRGVVVVVVGGCHHGGVVVVVDVVEVDVVVVEVAVVQSGHVAAEVVELLAPGIIGKN